MEQEKNTLTVLEIAPGQYPKQVEISDELKALQQTVGGSIGATYPFDDSVAIIYNDDGKLMGLPLNRALRDESGEAYDVIAGTFLVVSLGEEDFASLTPELAEKFEKQFHQPESFIPLGRRMLIVAGRNRAEVIQHYDFDHETVCPDSPQCGKSSDTAVSVQGIPRKAERPYTPAAESRCVQRGDQQDRYSRL